MSDDTRTAQIEEIRARHASCDYTAIDRQALADLWTLLAEVDQLARWKNEAMPVMDGLQELGRALDIPLGARITGPDALAAVEQLRADRDADRRELARLREEVRKARVAATQARLGREPK